MSRTYSDAITRIRRVLQDRDSANYRYDDDSMVDAINDAMLEIRRVRPDLFMAQRFDSWDFDLAVGVETVIPLEPMYFQSLVYLASGYHMLRDDEFSNDSRAVNLLNKGVSQLLTTAA